MENCITDKLHLVRIIQGEKITWYICKLDGFTNTYIEVFSKKRIEDNELTDIVNLKDYILSTEDYSESLISNSITKEQLLELFIEVNRTEILNKSFKKTLTMEV